MPDDERGRRKTKSRWEMAVGRWGEEEGRGRKTEVRSQESGVKSQESGVRSQESEGRRREGQGRTGARKCAVNPTQSDQIRPGSDESDRMKPVVDCKCAMAGVARWIGCIGRFTERRMAALDERFRLLTTSYVASVGGYSRPLQSGKCSWAGKDAGATANVQNEPK